MQSAWLRTRPQLPAVRLPGGTIPSAVLVFLIVIVVANSTVTVNWVPGSVLVTKVALLAALVFGLLALIRRIPWPVPVLLLVMGAIPVGLIVTQPALLGAHPQDPRDLLALGEVWLQRTLSGAAASEVVFYLLLMAILFWIVGGWLAWCVLRWRQPLLGLVPGAVFFATNILNYPNDQNGYTVAFLALTLSLLLWTTYQRSLDQAQRMRIRMSGDARWDFWESGVVVLVGVIVLGLFLPPISQADQSVDIENGLFRGWAEFQQTLNHPTEFGRGISSGTSIGFSSDVPLGGPISKTGGVVFTYNYQGNYGIPVYFRGLNITSPAGGLWRFSTGRSVRAYLAKDRAPTYAEDYRDMAAGTFTVTMLKPPAKATDVIFYPGELRKLDRDSLVTESLTTSLGPLNTIDRVSGLGTNGGIGNYKVTVAYSGATEDELRRAGTDYPAWVDTYRGFPEGYRPDATLKKVKTLAQQVTQGATNPYDQATAIERYLRDTANYTYTLKPYDPPTDMDPIEYFLFVSKQGYCEYFASAMGDMLRSLGIPTRLVNGYGPGTFDEHIGKYVVREADAHTWVEAYFPTYGWIPFEPTADGTYYAIPRGIQSGPVCTRDSCDTAADTDPAAAVPGKPKPLRGDMGDVQDAGGQTGVLGIPSPLVVPSLITLLLLFVFAVYIAGRQYLRPRTVGGVWSRTRRLVSLAGGEVRPGETPTEFGARMAHDFPEAGPELKELATRFDVAAYAPSELAATSKPAVMSAWTSLRPLLVRRVVARFRPA